MSQLPRAREIGRNVKEALCQYLSAVSCYWRDYWTSDATNIWGLLITKKEM